MLTRQLKLPRRAAVDLVGLAHYSWNPQTNELKWDARMDATWALPPGINADYDIWHNGIDPDDVSRVDAAVARCKDPRDGIYDIKYRVIGLDGVERWVHTRGRTYFKNAKPIDFAGVLLDITPPLAFGKNKNGVRRLSVSDFLPTTHRAHRRPQKVREPPASLLQRCLFATRFLLKLQRASDPSEAIPALTTWSPNCAGFMRATGLPPPGIPRKPKPE
jgi:hypothetical protein